MPQNARSVRRPTPERLKNAALYYLGRYAASEGSLRRVLQNKIKRCALRDDEFSADKKTQETLFVEIEKIIENFRKNGLLNDASFAEMKASSMRRAGKSGRRIAQSLFAKGVAAGHIDAALAPDEGEDPKEAENKAARAFAKKQRLGPYRKGEGAPDSKARMKEIAKMMRAGFSADIVKKILGQTTDEIINDE